MQVRDSSLPYEASRPGAEPARKYGEAIAPLFVAIFEAIDRVADAIVSSLRPTSPDDEYLARARSHAELRQRFHDLEQRRCHVALEVGR
jgi:hypothetical protein